MAELRSRSSFRSPACFKSSTNFLAVWPRDESFDVLLTEFTDEMEEVGEGTELACLGLAKKEKEIYQDQGGDTE